MFKELSYKSFYKVWSSHLYIEAFSLHFQEFLIRPPNLTSQIFVVCDIWRFWWFFQKVSEKINSFFFSNFEAHNTIVGRCQSTLRGCESCLQKWLLKSLCFWDVMFFMVFQKVFFRKLKFLKIWNSQRCIWVLWEYYQELQILHSNATAALLLVSEMWSRTSQNFMVF